MVLRICDCCGNRFYITDYLRRVRQIFPLTASPTTPSRFPPFAFPPLAASAKRLVAGVLGVFGGRFQVAARSPGFAPALLCQAGTLANRQLLAPAYRQVGKLFPSHGDPSFSWQSWLIYGTPRQSGILSDQASLPAIPFFFAG